MFFVYILRSVRLQIFYVGHTNDLAKRMHEHRIGRSPFTSVRGPWELVYAESYPTRAEAMKREKEIKKRKNKRFIVNLIEKSDGAWRDRAAQLDSNVG